MNEVIPIVRTISGSTLYNLYTADSDIDYVSVHSVSQKTRNRYVDYELETGTADDKSYELLKFFNLLELSKPNMLELLWVPDSHIVSRDAIIWDTIVSNREIFLSKKLKWTYTGYAQDQIDKCKGQNKWINNPQPEELPKIEDFCYIIDDKDKLGFPFRPVPIKSTKLDLRQFKAAGLEHVKNTYRIYWYGDTETDGVIRNGNVVVESIPKEDEYTRFRGLLIICDEAFNKAKLNHTNYWNWMKTRNPKRWLLQESGKVDYDVKNMQHCVRLMLSGIHIFKYGFPMVRIEGKQRQFLMSIREGKYTYDWLMNFVKEKQNEMEELFLRKDTFPDNVDNEQISKLYDEVMSLVYS